MPLDHATTFPPQLGACLKISDSKRKIWEYSVLASSASHYARLLSASNTFGQSDTEQARIYKALKAAIEDEAGRDLASQWTAWRAAVENPEDGLFKILDQDLPASDEKAAGGSIVYGYDELLRDGTVMIVSWNGYWGALRKDMLKQDYKVVANAIGFGSFAGATPNRGQLSVTSMSGISHALRGKSAGTLILTVESESVSRPQLLVQVQLAEPLPDGTFLITEERRLTPGKSFEGGLTALTMLLDRPGLASPTESGDGGNMFSSTSFETPKDGDMNGGVSEVRVVRTNGDYDFLIEWYANSERTNRVGAMRVAGTSGSLSIDKELQNGTRFQSTFSKTNAAAALPVVDNEDDDISWDIETPRKSDRWERPITNDQAGKISTKLAELAPVSLPTTGSNLYTDSVADSITI